MQGLTHPGDRRDRFLAAWTLGILLLSVILVITTNRLYLILFAPLFLGGWWIWQQPSRLFFLLLISIPLSTEVQVTPSLGTDFPDELLMVISSGLMLLVWISRPSVSYQKLRRNPLWLLLLIHLGWILITVIFSQQPILSVKYLLAKFWYVIPFVGGTLLLATNESQLRLIVICLLVPVVFTVLVILFRHAASGFRFESISDLTHPFYRNHVNYGAMVACSVPLAVAGWWLSKRLRLIRALIVFLLLVALFFSFSRGAWVALLAGLTVALAIRLRRIKGLMALVIVAAISLFIYFARDNRYLDYRPDYYKTIYHEDFRQHLLATYQFRDLSTAERFYRWIAAFRMMPGHWVNGYGPNTFYPSYKSHTVTAFRTYVSENKEHSTVHNYFLLLMTEQGIPGLLIFLCLLGYMFVYAEKLYHEENDRFYKVSALTASALLGIITTLILLSDLVETDKIGSLFFLVLGWLIRMDLNRQKNPFPQS